MKWQMKLAMCGPAALALVVAVGCTVTEPLEKDTAIARGNQAPSASSRIDGTVRSRTGGAAGIDVTAFPVAASPGEASFATKTDAAGRFSLALPAGTYNLIASKPGTTDRAVGWSVQSATTVNLDLVATGAISGTLSARPAIDPTGMLVFVPGTSFVAAADAEGAFTIDAVPVGTVSIMAVAAGYAPATLAAVTVRPGQTTGQANLVLLPTSASTTQFSGVSGLPPGGQIGARFVGANTCKLCHPEAFSVYSLTAHWTIRDLTTWSGRTNNSCKSCHSVGEDPANPGKSLLMPDSTPAGFDFTKAWLDPVNDTFRGIQCENCHGPGGNHVNAALIDKDTTITARPNYMLTCVRCHNTAFNRTWNGASDADVNAGGGYGAPKHPQGLAYLANGGYTYGKTFPASAHQTLVGNGCINCHMGNGSFPGNHQISIAQNRDAYVKNVCQKCHESDFTSESIDAYQAQIKLSVDALEKVLVEYRQAFCLEVMVATSGTQPIPFSTAPEAIANLALKASTWDDSPASVSAGFPHQSGKNPTADATSWSLHQKAFNRAYWNMGLIEADKSWAIHAPTYQQSLIRASYNDLIKDLPSSASYQVLRLRGSASFERSFPR